MAFQGNPCCSETWLDPGIPANFICRQTATGFVLKSIRFCCPMVFYFVFLNWFNDLMCDCVCISSSDGSDLDWQRCPNASDGICRWDNVSQFFNPDEGELCVYVVAQTVSNKTDYRPMTRHASQETCHDLRDLKNPNHQVTGSQPYCIN